MKKNYSNEVKIIIILFISFCIVSLVSTQLFMAGTTKLNPTLIAKLSLAPQYLASLPEKLVSSIKNIFSKRGDIALSESEVKASLNAIPNAIPPSGAIFKTISTGVLAADDPSDPNIKYIQLQSGTKISIKTQTIIDANGNKKVIKLIQY